MYASWNARAVGLGLTAGETVEVAARAGFGAVDLLLRDLVESGVDPWSVRGRMDELGLRGGAWPLPVHWRGNPEQFAEDLRDLPRYARAAATLDLQRTGTWVLPETDSTFFPGTEGDDLLRQTVSLHVERLGKIAGILADHGSRLGLEIMGPASARRGPGAVFVHQYRRLAEHLGELRAEHPNVGVLVDAFHLFAAGEGVEAGFVWGVDSVVWVHVADSADPDRLRLLDQQRALPGETGLADCRGLLKRLAEEGYDGPVTVEPLKHCRSLQGLDALATARRTLASLQTVWPSPLADACTRRPKASSMTIRP
ncbi:MAG: sugar phosphate isomerase/epimerase family protein [Isosphaeraceae bacterium]|jgi:sugar phosphate isomerase/epimerase